MRAARRRAPAMRRARVTRGRAAGGSRRLRCRRPGAAGRQAAGRLCAALTRCSRRIQRRRRQRGAKRLGFQGRTGAAARASAAAAAAAAAPAGASTADPGADITVATTDGAPGAALWRHAGRWAQIFAWLRHVAHVPCAPRGFGTCAACMGSTWPRLCPPCCGLRAAPHVFPFQHRMPLLPAPTDDDILSMLCGGGGGGSGAMNGGGGHGGGNSGMPCTAGGGLGSGGGADGGWPGVASIDGGRSSRCLSGGVGCGPAGQPVSVASKPASAFGGLVGAATLWAR